MHRTFFQCGKDPSDPNRYRPISLLNALSKILERLLLHRLKSHVAEHRKYLNVQFGFREKHSTSHQLRVTKHITFRQAAKLSTGGMLFWTFKRRLTVCGTMRCLIKFWSTASLWFI
jgi:hypothetical protein